MFILWISGQSCDVCRMIQFSITVFIFFRHNSLSYSPGTILPINYIHRLVVVWFGVLSSDLSWIIRFVYGYCHSMVHYSTIPIKSLRAYIYHSLCSTYEEFCVKLVLCDTLMCFDINNISQFNRFSSGPLHWHWSNHTYNMWGNESLESAHNITKTIPDRTTD